jgi:hypothetical protein
MKNFINSNEEFPPINCRVFENYDHLDALAEKRGYHAVENENQAISWGINAIGLQNNALHAGWIATFDDSNVKAQSQVALLKEKIIECISRNESIIIGFCRTGNFSVGYSIYVKNKA